MENRSTVDWRRAAIALLGFFPKALVSRWAGRLAALPLPLRARAPLLGLFGRVVGVNFDELPDSIGSFESLQAFFTRPLRPGARPIDSATDAFVAPCDGAWGESGVVRDGLLLQIKGRPYSLAALLGDAETARRFEGGQFATFYLSPRDYHRFHTCCDVRVLAARYLPGTLWPVNRLGVEGVDGLFTQNERICAFMEVSAGMPSSGGTSDRGLCLVAVGATMVGKIRLTFDDLTTNVRGAEPILRDYAARGIELPKGAEWGHFEFGSTIVLLSAPGTAALDTRPPGSAVRMGTRIGRLLPVDAGRMG